MSTSVQVCRPTLSSVDAPALRIPSWLADAALALFTGFALPNIVILCVFGHSGEFFRGWLNVELALCVCILFAFGPSRIAISLVALELIADLFEPIAHTFYFSSSDAIEALRFVTVLPVPRLLLYALGIAVYVAAMLFIMVALSRRVTNRRLSCSLVFAVVLIAGGTDVCTGRYSQFSHSDVRLAHLMLIRDPLAAIGSKTWSRHQHQKSQVIDSWFRHLSPAQKAEIIGNRVNVVTVLVESWGLFNDATLRSSLVKPFLSSEVAARYEIDSGTVPFVGSTIYGESRSLCGEIFDSPLENVGAERLSHCYPAEFARAGYSTVSIHGFSPHMYSRDRWMPKVGFQQELFAPELKAMGMRTCSGGLAGTCDGDIADYIHRRLLTDRGHGKDFIHWTTLNSHLPVEVNTRTVQEAGCANRPEFQNDDAVCVWDSLVYRVNAQIAQIAMDKDLPATVFAIVGDHAPPFYNASRRSRFSQTRVPYIILKPRQ